MMRTMRYAAALTALLFCVLLPHASAARPLVPEEYAAQATEYFTDEDWEAGRAVLEEGLRKYPKASDLQGLMGKYWFHARNYDKARYHLVKAVEGNYENLQAKKLLVDVEEATHNWSSAICYVNELLEAQPYDRGLWRRKIYLYRRQGNTVEADRLLRRINQIYPQDTVLRKDYIYEMELKYQRLKSSGDRRQAIATLEELLRSEPANEQYYLDLVNLLLQEGDVEKALDRASTGLALVNGSVALVYKKAGILSELGRWPEALAFLRSRMKVQDTPELRRLYNGMLLEAARAERQRDAYILYGMAYERGERSREALDYLLSTALLRGYDDDALYYLRETRRIYGDDKALLYKEYLIYRNMGERTRAFNLLARLVEEYPGDRELVDALCTQRLDLAARLMEREQYSEALPAARYVLALRPDPEIERAAWDKVLGCQIGMRRYDDALSTLDTLAVRYPGYDNAVGKRAYLLDHTGRTTEALALYRTAAEQAEPRMRSFYAAGYADIALPYIKKCIEAGAVEAAFAEAEALHQIDPRNDPALRYAINTADILGRDDAFRRYTKEGLARFPGEPFYAIKKAALFDREGDYEASLALLRPLMEQYPGNRELAGAYAQSSEYRALALIRADRPLEAVTVVDAALVYDRRNPSLHYAKGLAYEKMKRFDLAYFYQKDYEPAVAERSAHLQHLKGLRHAMLRNQIGLEYIRARYAAQDVLTSVATLEYTRRTTKNDYTGRINYAGRDGTPDNELSELGDEAPATGGVGIQLQAEWTHAFSDRWRGMVNFAWADRYFPRLAANLSATRYFARDWEMELHAGYRRIDGGNLWTVGPGAAKTWDPLRISAKVDLFLLDSRIYYNATAQLRYYPVADQRSYIVGMAGIGSAPELTVIDRAMPGAYSHANTMVGLGGQYLLTPHLALGLLGTWHTYYTEKRTGYDTVLTRYRNFYEIHVQLYFTF